MKSLIRKMLGIDKLEQEQEELSQKLLDTAKQLVETEQATARAKEEERVAKLTPKERATEAKEPWVAVLDTHVNKDNIRNGFFELDWNEYFVLELRQAGYKGDTDESVVDQWFQELCRNVGAEANVNMERRGSGFINVNNLGDGRSEIS